MIVTFRIMPAQYIEPFMCFPKQAAIIFVSNINVLVFAMGLGVFSVR
jgi:hypothetical protein